MKIQLTTVVGLLLPLTVLAAPVTEADELVEIPVALEDDSRHTSSESFGLGKRANQSCKIVNTESEYVKCRSGPGFSHDIQAVVYPAKRYKFTCYKSGDCYENNCTWDAVKMSNGKYCYVNGYYTDDKCTAAALGQC
ncbi:hypothetical protein BDW42DRAFT_33253 [Aspergillus taichungensis]|uniref:Antifungal protein n=1 Tax=Aspergillus taichungensis TaxID=482145 RepID=A0A2J5HFY6_9EURO|nr:hypothetical protein BDW42DRAFT_33253 [Aspergillus taichungensis]